MLKRSISVLFIVLILISFSLPCLAASDNAKKDAVGTYEKCDTVALPVSKPNTVRNTVTILLGGAMGFLFAAVYIIRAKQEIKNNTC